MNRAIESTPRKATTLLFDMDDTLYPRSSGLMKEVSRRIGIYIRDLFGISMEQADRIRVDYKNCYGSSLVGLVHIEKIDPCQYADFVYDIDYARFISPDPRLVGLLESVPLCKILYTNGSRRHADAVLKQLQIEHLFDQIVSVEDVRYLAKPLAQSYREMFLQTGLHPSETVFFDDQERNLIAAARFGMGTVLVDGISDRVGVCVRQLCDLSPL